jgi:glycerol-3-phosphate dehydrogenase (NAD(P)+)
MHNAQPRSTVEQAQKQSRKAGQIEVDSSTSGHGLQKPGPLAVPDIPRHKGVPVRAAVIGAGYMGSAITFPLSANNIEVNLWGTWLDDKIISSSLAGFHPKLKKALAPTVTPMYSKDLAKALSGIDMLFMAVTSEGFVKVFEMVLDNLASPVYFFKLTKGLVSYKGSVVRATQAALDMLSEKFGPRDFAWATIGGPVRALDLAYEMPSVSMYGITNERIKDIIPKLKTDYYRIVTKEDVIGVELSSTFKNIYAMAPGICDGLFRKNYDGLYFNLTALLFAQAVKEISKIVERAGGDRNTVFDFAGVGDLYVTSAAGRNRKLGDLVGKGVDPQKAFKDMSADGEYGEGYIALKLAALWLETLDKKIIEELPLFKTLFKIFFDGGKPINELKKLVLKI